MIGVIAQLMQGDTRLAVNFQRTVLFWQGFHLAHRQDTVEDLARHLGGAQDMYEHECWDMDRYLGKTTMPWTALASLWHEQNGWGDDEAYAARLAAAFQHPACACSMEVKFSAEDAKAVYKPGR